MTVTVRDKVDELGVALVTGGAGPGIGQGISRVLACEGWHVVIADVDAAAGQALVAQLVAGGGRAEFRLMDVSSEEQVGAVTEAVATTAGPIRVLVNSAGVGLLRPVGDATTDEWAFLMNVDLRGAWLTSRACLPAMVEQGSGVIVNIASVQALGAAAGYGIYAAAKSGIVGLTRGIAADYGQHGVRAVVVHPGMVDSPQNREIFATWGDPQEFINDYLARRQLLPRLIKPEDVGDLVAFLVSDRARSITAAEFTLDAGSSAMAFDRSPGTEKRR